MNTKQIILFIGLIVSVSAAFASGGSCVSSASELNDNPRIKQIVDSMGGIQSLQGVWKFNGIMGIGKTTVVFQSRPDEGGAFNARIDDSGFSRVKVCESSQSKTLQIQVASRDPASEGTILLRPGKTGHIQLAGDKSKGRFYSFSKIEMPGADASTPELLASRLAASTK